MQFSGLVDVEFTNTCLVIALRELATCFISNENYEEAEKYTRRAVDIARKGLGQDHIDTFGRKYYNNAKRSDSESGHVS